MFIPRSQSKQLLHLNITSMDKALRPDRFSDCTTYESAKETLKKKCMKPTNEIFVRHLLATRKQQPNETLMNFYSRFKY